MQYMTIVIRV